ncbi:hypothetical protein RD792_002035 [Penstemon davidsonii]|uniref:BTB domain-containing protein n=1 Tax=Penstemon davidsonii TaxID=160366 RepID=A0ABR0DPX7_9LAMI|nr:hypothetical protein RD792_002035 [Penstemon davidsonii]
MGRSSALLNGYTYNFFINGCTKGRLYGDGEQVHVKVLRSGVCSNVHVGTSLVDFYVKCGGDDCVVKAKHMFDEMPDIYVVSWNSLLLGCFRCGGLDDAQRLFDEVPERSVVSWTTMIAGCLQNGRCKEALEKTRVLVRLNNALIHVYSSCGEIDAAFAVFQAMEQQTIVSWTSMITGFAKHGYGDDALSMFQRMISMEKKDIKPDEITFLGVLSACSHSGYVDEGRHYFKTMIETWGIEPKIEHYGIYKNIELASDVADWLLKELYAAAKRSHESAGMIYDVLDEVTREARGQGYMPYFADVVVNIENEDEYNFKGIGVGKYIVSDTFSVEGHLWEIQFYPDGYEKVDASGDIYVSVYIRRLTSMDGPKTFAQPLPLSDLGESYRQLLESREGSDVTFEVKGEIFYAHRLILATRSPVFKAQFFGPLKEENTRCVQIEEMLAPVFKALLHFIYCHVIPDFDSKCVATTMTQHLLAAADRYGIEKLKSLCEARLRENIAIDTVASTLALAEQHGCFQLRSICLEFIGLPKNLEDVMQTDGFKNMKENCPAVIDELFKSVARLRDCSLVSNEPRIKELEIESFSCYRGVAHICGLAIKLLFRFLWTR